MRNISAGNVCLRYYPDGEPWMEPKRTNRFTFGGKERVSLEKTKFPKDAYYNIMKVNPVKQIYRKSDKKKSGSNGKS